jgi:glycosyltransferase involved in cell wall biosynthesis
VRNKVNVHYFPIGPIISENRFLDELKPYFNQEMIVARNSSETDSAPCLKIWHQHDLAHFIGNGEHIGFPIFELDKFTKRELSHLNSCDRLIVCSDWAKNILFANDIIEPAINVVPLGYDPEIFTPTTEVEPGTFVFANFGKWEVRKGHDILATAFSSAFSQDDDVELWMFPHNQHLNKYQQDSWEQFYYRSKLGSKIKIFPRQPDQSALANYMKRIHCGVFPSRAEGWNLEALECLACGKQVIATNRSAHTEFLTKENSTLIDMTETETAYDGVFFNGQGNWGKFSNDTIEQLVEAMRFAYNNRSVNTQGIADSKELTWEKAGQKLVSVLHA